MLTQEQQLARIDLNLLNVLQVLLAERNVSRAAERLFISQPAMSNKLQRLRDLLDDPVLVRTHQGLTPTAKALQLQAPVARILAQVSAALLQGAFDPATSEAQINIQVPDSLSVVMIPALYQELSRQAPQLRLTSDNTTADHLHLLESGRADFSLYVNEDYGNDFLTWELGTLPSLCWMRTDHPLAGIRELSLAHITAYPLAELTLLRQDAATQSSDPNVQRLLELTRDYGLRDRQRVGSSQLLTLIGIILATDTLFLGAPNPYLLKPNPLGLCHRQIKEFADVRIPIALIQHRITANSSLHTWLRERIVSTWQELGISA